MRIHLCLLLLGVVLLAACNGDDDAATVPPPGTEPPAAPGCIPVAPDQPAPGYVGLTEAEAVARAEEEGLDLRIVGVDGECFPMTLDLRPDRVNIELRDDVVVAAAVF